VPVIGRSTKSACLCSFSKLLVQQLSNYARAGQYSSCVIAAVTAWYASHNMKFEIMLHSGVLSAVVQMIW
jgi:hypothetical protein